MFDLRLLVNASRLDGIEFDKTPSLSVYTFDLFAMYERKRIISNKKNEQIDLK
jgi:hypothetical protein